MTWRPDHSPPAKREGWVSVETGGPYASRITDYCPKHGSKERKP